MKRWDRIAGVVLFALAVLVIEQSLVALDLFLTHMPGPGLMPLGLGILLAALAIGLVVTNWGPDARPVALWVGNGWIRVVIALALFVGYAAAIDWLGYAVSVVALVAGWLVIEERKPVWVALVTGGLTGLAFYVVFTLGLQVPLPRGVLFGG